MMLYIEIIVPVRPIPALQWMTTLLFGFMALIFVVSGTTLRDGNEKLPCLQPPGRGEPSCTPPPVC